MKKLLSLIASLVLGIALAGCGMASKEIASKAQGGRTGVFQEVHDGGQPPEGHAYLVIKASVKTHLEGHYLLEPEGTYHGKTRYPFVVNIDGQALVWEADGKEESTPLYEGGRKNPEGGEGVRYALEKRIRLAPGAHNIFFGFMGDGKYTEISLTAEGGRSYTIEFKPVYKRYRHEGERFARGVSRILAFLNNAPVQDR